MEPLVTDEDREKASQPSPIPYRFRSVTTATYTGPLTTSFLVSPRRGVTPPAELPE